MSTRVCPECQIEMRPLKNGVYAVAMACFGPVDIYAADLWHCPECHKKVLCGFAPEPFASHYEPDFAPTLSRLEASLNALVIPYWLNAGEKAASADAIAEATL